MDFNGIFQVFSISLSLPHMVGLSRPHCKRGASNFGGIGREPWAAMVHPSCNHGNQVTSAWRPSLSWPLGARAPPAFCTCWIRSQGLALRITEIRDGNRGEPSGATWFGGTCWKLLPNPRFGGCLVFLESEIVFFGGRMLSPSFHHSSPPTAEVRHQRRTEPALRVGWCFRVALVVIL